MDAVEFLRARRKLCDDNVCGESCPLFYCCDDGLEDDRIRQVLAVEQWSKEHQVKTRQSEFLKIFPSAQIEDETVSICPAKLNVAPHATNMGRTCIYVHDCAECRKCKRDFWLTEISEGKADKNAPEAITRCRDCRYSSRDKETYQTWCNYSTERMETSVNWYCHHGKRREG